MIDPVGGMRWPTSVPPNVQYYWNRYRTKGDAVSIAGLIRPHGAAQGIQDPNRTVADQVDLNPDGQHRVTHGFYTGTIIDHWNIIPEVEDTVEALMRAGPT